VSGRGSNNGNGRIIAGILPGSTGHLLLLALRGPGGMTSEQVAERFPSYPSGTLHRLQRIGYIEMPGMGTKAKPIRLTDKGRAVIAPDGPLARRNSLITYCQL
jgi:hypothetical protein